MATTTKSPTLAELLSKPDLLSKAVEEYFDMVDARPVRKVTIGKNVVERRIPYTVPGLCLHLGMTHQAFNSRVDNPPEKGDRNGEAVRKILAQAATRIECATTERALIGDLDANVARLLVSGYVGSASDSDDDGGVRKALIVKIQGMSDAQVKECSK